jgi:eukaryotic-like serine/threonine-protein kinase
MRTATSNLWASHPPVLVPWCQPVASIQDFVAELRRRRVFRVAAAYAVAGWVVVEAAATLIPHLLLPEWLVRAVIVIVLLGFPLALVLAWAYDITPAGIRATGAAGDESGGEAPRDAADDDAFGDPTDGSGRGASRPSAREPRRARTAVGVALGAVAFFALALAVAGWLMLAGTEDWNTEDLVARLGELVAEQRYPEAFQLLESSGASRADLPEGLVAEFTDGLSVLTEPAGARVEARRFDPADPGASPAAWQSLGQTPLRAILLPRGDYLLRIEREGYGPVERLASTTTARDGMPVDHVPETLFQLRLIPADDVPDGMVHVPGGPYAIASRNLQGELADLRDFFIDRHEVTNARYADFVAAGGYLEPRYWSDASVDHVPGPDRSPPFRDRTGLPAPRSWSGQRYPSGTADHPVTGVTWYEAAAYCRFHGGRLPTLFEWEKAARDGQISYREGIYMPWGMVRPGSGVEGRANFSGEGTTPVDHHPFGLSPYGAYDMAGNVKEWLSNATENERAITGGAWEDPAYLFAEVGGAAPTTSSNSLGFRCVRSAGGGPPGDADRPLRLAVDTPSYQPVDEATFRALLSHYAYDHAPVEAEVLERIEAPGWVRERIRYTGPGGEVIAYLYLPNAARQPYQTTIFVPGSDVFFGVTVPDATEWLLAPVIRAGRAVFAVVMEGMTERPYPPDTPRPEPATVRFRDQMVRHATELRMGLDYLETRADIDANALAYTGLSWGAGSRLVFAAVDDRFRAVILVGGGIDERVQPTLPEASNIAFAPWIRPPKLLLNGQHDDEHPWPTRGLPLWNLLSEPRELVLVEGAGHVPPLEERIPAILDFLDRTLGPVQR